MVLAMILYAKFVLHTYTINLQFSFLSIYRDFPCKEYYENLLMIIVSGGHQLS